MEKQPPDLEQFQTAWLDFLEGERDGPPDKSVLPAHLHARAAAFEDSLTACRGVDPHASRPPLAALLRAEGMEGVVAKVERAHRETVATLEERDRDRTKVEQMMRPDAMLRRIVDLELRIEDLEQRCAEDRARCDQ